MEIGEVEGIYLKQKIELVVMSISGFHQAKEEEEKNL